MGSLLCMSPWASPRGAGTQVRSASPLGSARILKGHSYNPKEGERESSLCFGSFYCSRGLPHAAFPHGRIRDLKVALEDEFGHLAIATGRC